MDMSAESNRSARSEGRAPSAQRERAVLAWPWLWTALVIEIVITVAAWVQDPQPIPIVASEPMLSIWKPIEINPQLRLLPVAGSLNSVTFMMDGQRGWAVGTGGAIIATTDAGRIWRRQTSNTTDFLHTVFFLPDGKHGWAVGINGAIVATKDGGRRWNRQQSNLAIRTIPITLETVTFLADGLHGWAGGGHGTILATDDGGARWYAQQTNTERNIDFLWFDSASHRGFAIADGGSYKLLTEDRGRSWVVTKVEDSPFLGMTMTFLSDGKRGWTVGGMPTEGYGAITTDGGRTWRDMKMPAASTYRALAFHRDGKHGWAVGDSGAFSATADGGTNWRRVPIGTRTNLSAVAIGDDPLHGWVFGNGGTVLATSDGGRSWHHQTRNLEMPATPGRYMRFPAPWYPIATLLCAGLVWMSWRRRSAVTPKESIADVAASDAEVSAPDDDRLEFAGLARGISRFLRNTATSPPLTLAVTGGWGTGKTSLMRLVCADLQRFGHHPIWFNAWHYQKEEHLFAALLGAIKTQGVPRLLTWKGISFRLCLLWLRSRRHVGIAIILVVIVTAQVVMAVAGFSDNGIIGARESLRDASLWSAGLSSTAAITALFAVIKGTRLFGLDPALLLTGVRDNLNLKTAVAQNDFRAQFAHDFRQLIDALPYRLFIVIDDLDRCRPEAVLEVMETVNYLTSAGKCFVMFGMATERVQASIGLAFKDIAAELVQMEHDSEPGAAPGNETGNAALAKRRTYARDYLQKLVNIEIRVPTDQSALAHTLLLLPPGRRQRMQSMVDMARHWPVALTVAALCTGVWLAGRMLEDASVPRTAISEPSAAAVTPQPTPVGPARVAQQTIPIATEQTTLPVVQEAQQSLVERMIVLLGIAIVPGFAAAAVALVRLLKPDAPETHDSPRFRQALQIWASVVAAKHGTPRSIKRFGNRIRYFAMLQQGDILTVSWRQRGAFLFRRLWRQEELSVPASVSQTLDEAHLIAMGAIYEVAAERWRDVVRNGQWNEQGRWTVEDRLLEAGLTSIVNQAIDRHQQEFDTVWPPTAEEIAVFEHLIVGVRLSGDPHVIQPVMRASRSGATDRSASQSAS